MGASGLGFSVEPWPFLILVLLGAALAWALYLRRRSFKLLAALTVLAWIALALWCVRPFWNRVAETYHAPTVVLAVDRSASMDALGIGAEIAHSLASARAHYQALGFRVVSLSFAEKVLTEKAMEKDRRGDAGVLTDPSAVRDFLDSLPEPNLQGILWWADGRANLDPGFDAGRNWPAPVFPVLPAAAGEARLREVQGESLEADFSDPDSGAMLRGVWRCLGNTGCAARLEIRAGDRLLRRVALSAPDGAPQKFRLRLAGPDASDPEQWTALLLPEPPAADPIPQNDTVAIRLIGLRRHRQLFARPVNSLAERGLFDALRAPDSGGLEAFAVAPESLAHALPPAMIWLPLPIGSGGDAPAAAHASAPVVEYFFPSSSQGVTSVFRGEARLSWRDEGRAFLPDAALRLADLGGEAWMLPAPSPDRLPLAWAEQDGRKGLLFWRKRGSSPPVFGLAVPPLWTSVFRADPDARIADAQRCWVRGAAEWARAQGNVSVTAPDPIVAGRAFSLEARSPPADSQGSSPDARWELTEGKTVLARAPQNIPLRFENLSLSAGLHTLRVTRENAPGAMPVWSGTLRVRAARDVELARLGVDRAALDSLAAVAGGRVLTSSQPGDSIAWPEFARGASRETRAISTPLAPGNVFVLVVALLFLIVWALRKKFRLDA